MTLPGSEDGMLFLNPKIQKIVFLTGIIFLISLLSSIVILSLVPPVSRDALVHHLAIPKIYLQEGKCVELPCMDYSYYPMNLDLLYMIALYAGSDIAAKFIHFAFGIMTAGLIFCYLKKRLGKENALIGAILFFTVPVIIKLSITVYVDLGLIFFSTASILSIMQWVAEGFKIRWLIYSAILCGLAMGTKYNGFITFLLLTLFVPFSYSRNNIHGSHLFLKSTSFSIIFVLIALAVCSPWLIRNYRWTGNPVYPLYNHYLLPESYQGCEIDRVAGPQPPKISPLQARKLIYNESWADIMFLPLRIFFQGKDNSPRKFDGELTPMLLLLPLFAFWGSKRTSKYSEEKWVLLIFSVLFFLLTVFSTGLRIRYFSPSIPCLVILSSFGIHNLVSVIGSKKLIPHTLSATIGLFLITCFIAGSTFQYLANQFEVVKPFKYLKNELNRDEYISLFRQEYPVFQYVNTHLPQNATVLFLYMGKRGYYCNRSYIVDQGRNLSNIFLLINKHKNSNELKNWLSSMSITHLILHNASVKKALQDNPHKIERSVFMEYMNDHTKMLYQKNGFELYEVLSEKIHNK